MKRGRLLRPRWFARMSAYYLGNFWLPCPFPGCGKMFAGFEWPSGAQIELDDFRGVGICPRHEPRRYSLAELGLPQGWNPP